MSTNVASSSKSSDASDASHLAENSLSNPAVSERFRQRMQPCPEPVWQRASCPCCGRNFRQASECLQKFQDTIRQALGSGSGSSSASSNADSLADFAETERRILLSDSFLLRLLARCGCDSKRALERLMMARVVHRKYSLDTSLTCRACAETPGYHSFRQVGFDRLGRPVLYTCLNQDAETGTQPEQVLEYFLHLILTVAEAEKTIPDGQHSLVLVFDTRGLGLHHIRTDTVSQFGEMLKYFPARMSYALLLNMSSVTRFLLKPIVHLTGHKDDVIIMSSQGMDRQLSECFDPPLVRWMLREMERNQLPKMQFCSGPAELQQQQQVATAEQREHDPRGEAAYVENFVIKRHLSGHRPHPSIAAANADVHGSGR